MNFLKMIIEKYRKKIQERNAACNSLISRIDAALSDAKSIFSVPNVFIDPCIENEWRSRNNGIFTDSETNKILLLKKATKYKTLCEKRLELVDFACSMLL